MNDNDILDLEAVGRLKGLVETARKIVLTCHVSPDGDAMGSTLGLARVLQLMGKHPIVITPDVRPNPWLSCPAMMKWCLQATNLRQPPICSTLPT